ncbi:hypothetical protein WJX75_007672 [Coccomyxa subellipsoidea]|uniref:L domain-like protein n=1 Tax=Coccomyxa subellipsoidea TaxID=248742 RepID=A0ABR2Z3V3_9CHLO
MKIFKEVENSYGRYTRTHLPLVCKRWRQIIFGSRGVFFNRLTWTFHDSFPVLNVAACGAWFQRQLATGCISGPLSVSINDYRETESTSPTSEEFSALLGCTGHMIITLYLRGCAALFPSKSFETFWALPNLTYLCLSNWGGRINMEDFDRGMQHLRKLQTFTILSEEEISQLTRLSTLTMNAGCGLELRLGHLPSALARLPALVSLSIDGKLISVEGPDPGPGLLYDAEVPAPNDWKQMSKLRSLYLCPITCCIGRTCPCLPPEVELMTNLQEMSLYGYVRTGDAQEPDLSALKELTDLQFFSSILPNFPAWTARIPLLQKLRIHGKVHDWHIPESYSALQDLIIMTDLREVPESICALTTLTRLDLGECKVAKISPSISKLTRLRDLNLRYNYLYPEVPQELGALTWLHTLYLRYNKARRTKHMKVHKDGSGNVLLPKMAVTESSLLWLLRCKHMQQVFLDVTREERDKLSKFRQEMRTAFHGRPVLSLRLCGPYI